MTTTTIKTNTTDIDTVKYTDIAKRNKIKAIQKETTSSYNDDDALQDAILRVIEQGANPDYLPVMARQCMIDGKRKQSVRSHSDVDDYSEIIGGHTDNQWMICHILSALNNEQKQVFKLYFLEGLTVREIGDLLKSKSEISRQLTTINNIISSLKLPELIDYRQDRAGAETITDKHWLHGHDETPSEATIMDGEDLEQYKPSTVPARYSRWYPGKKEYRPGTWEWITCR